MNKTALIMSHEIAVTLRRKSFIFFAFGLPLIIAVVALILVTVRDDDGGEPVSIMPQNPETQGYVDPGGLIQRLPPEFPEGLLVPYADEAAAAAALEAETISGYYLIAPDYAESGKITLVMPSYSPMGANVQTNYIEMALFANLYQGETEDAMRAWTPVYVTERRLTAPEADGEFSWVTEVLPNLMALILYLIVIMTASVLVQSITDEKKNRVLEVMLSSASSDQFITGKILGVGALGVLMTLAWVGVTAVILNFGGEALAIPLSFKLPADLLVWAVVYIFLGYAMYGAQMAGLGALVPDLKDSRGAVFLVLMPFIVVYMFLALIVANPNGPIALFFSFFPLTAPVGMVARMAKVDVPLWQGILSAALQAVAAILIMRLMGRLFRAQVLLSGQPFSVKRYYGLMFGRGGSPAPTA